MELVKLDEIFKLRFTIFEVCFLFQYVLPEEVGHGWTSLIKMAEVIVLLYVNRQTPLTYNERNHSFQIKIQGWVQASSRLWYSESQTTDLSSQGWVTIEYSLTNKPSSSSNFHSTLQCFRPKGSSDTQWRSHWLLPILMLKWCSFIHTWRAFSISTVYCSPHLLHEIRYTRFLVLQVMLWCCTGSFASEFVVCHLNSPFQDSICISSCCSWCWLYWWKGLAESVCLVSDVFRPSIGGWGMAFLLSGWGVKDWKVFAWEVGEFRMVCDY